MRCERNISLKKHVRYMVIFLHAWSTAFSINFFLGDIENHIYYGCEQRGEPF